ncbi:DNA-binding protein [Rhizobium tropici]|uniref:DNA-binding protein n=2 Tax=Rhizobium tropici TaxID=398 RepID=A0A329Y9H2_RHITR|nr:DNA-binding protein [Rhizobium tropici]
MKRLSGPHLCARDVCERYSISKRTLNRWMKDDAMGFPKPIEINRILYWREKDIADWELRQQGIDPNTPQSAAGYEVVSGPIGDYRDLVEALRKQRERLKLSVMEVDAIAGMQEGYTNKLENWGRPYGRGAGPEILPLWLGGLRTALVLVELPRRPRNLTA